MVNSINEFRSAIPSKDAMSFEGFRQIRGVLNRLYNVLQSPHRNHKLYEVLYEKHGTLNPLELSPYSIEFYKDLTIPIYFKLILPQDTISYGSFSVKRGEIRLVLALKGDDKYKELYWDDGYEEILVHEVTHLYQALDVAMRVLRKYNKPINSKNLIEFIAKVASRRNSGDIMRGLDKLPPDKQVDRKISYSSLKSELGANANALLNYLANTHGIEAIEDIVNYVEKGYPTFEDIDNAIKVADPNKRTAWHLYDQLIYLEKRDKGINRDEWTKGYQLKKTLLKVMVEFYKRHYRTRR